MKKILFLLSLIVGLLLVMVYALPNSNREAREYATDYVRDSKSTVSFGSGNGYTPPPKKEKKEKQELLATIKPFEGYAIEIRNDNSSVWNEITFTINDKYSYTADSLDTGETFIFELSRFTKNDGERFNHITHAIKTFSIKCIMDDRLCFDIWES